MNESTERVFKFIKEATTTSDTGSSFRSIWKPSEGATTFKGLAELFDRGELETEYMTTLEGTTGRYKDRMNAQAQNDLIAPVHRDIALRYSKRIHRILAETGRRMSLSADGGFIDQRKKRLDDWIKAAPNT